MANQVLGYCEICEREDVGVDGDRTDTVGTVGICARCWRETPWGAEARAGLAAHGACLCDECCEALATLADDEAHAKCADGLTDESGRPDAG